MINAEEILKKLNSVVIVKNDNQIVYTNKSVNMELLRGNRNSSKQIIGSDGLEYEIVVYYPKYIKEYDSVTGLYSKGTFDFEAKNYYENSVINNEEFCVIFMDLDNFKKINDTYGHLNADKILRIVGKIIRNNVRSTDLCARFGGDEFVVLLKAASEEIAIKITEKIKEEISMINAEFNNSSTETIVSSSFGIASSNISNSLDAVLNAADSALYKAKENKGTIEIYEKSKEK